MSQEQRSPARRFWLAVSLLIAVAAFGAGCATADTPVGPAANASASAGPDATRAAATPIPAMTTPPAQTATPTAAFMVTGLMLEGDPASVRPGDDVTVSARVHNTGGAPGTYEAMLTVDGALFGRQLVDLAPGFTAIVRFSVAAGVAGDHVVQLDSARLTLRVLGPAALTLSALDASPNPVDAGDPVQVRVTVGNTGGEAGTRTVTLRVDGKAKASHDVTVSGGGQEVVLFSLRAPAAGRHTVSVGELDAPLLVWDIARPSNGDRIVNRLGGGYGRVTVRNRGGSDAVVILARSSAPKKAVLGVYVRAGKSATVSGISDGTYVAYFASGRRWDTYSRTFTASELRRRFDNPLKYRTSRTATQIRYTTWTLTLQASGGDGAPTTSVGEDDLPGMR